MNTERILIKTLKKELAGFLASHQVLPQEIEGVEIDFISILGDYELSVSSQTESYDVILNLSGEGILVSEGEELKFNSNFIIRPAFNKHYSISVQNDKEIHFLRIRKFLSASDLQYIFDSIENHTKVYMETLASCPVYTEDIKSSKTINRMILPEGLIPRFCMGSVETMGPDLVMEHEHPMLDQLFFGLENCKCTCFANGGQTILSENMMLHVPLGSKHSVSVAKGDTMAYIWLDFFTTLEGQKYIEEQHQMDDK